MYSKNMNQQTAESRRMIRDALLSLMRQHPYRDITITQICQEAQVVRQTYYRNFEVKDDILEYHLDGLFKQYFEGYYTGKDALSQLRDFFGFMLQNREFLQLVSRNDLFFMINRTITQNVARFWGLWEIANLSDPATERYITGFIAETVCSLLSLWVENEFLESVEWMSALAERLLSGLHADVHTPSGADVPANGR